ncbi:MAG TPA: hypothetical protein VFH50_01475 [Acidimicrobiales bacterium]|nr:hypothetical protein [Acidimicrobiales bacterium]
MRSGVRAVVAAACFCALGAGASACGGAASNGEEAKSATQVLTDAKAAMGRASSFHVSGHFTQQGSAIAIDLNLSPQRGGGTVTVSGATLDEVVAGGTIYLKADEKSWQKLTNSASEAQLLAGHWIKAPTSNPDFTDLASVADEKQLLGGITPEGSLTRRPGTTDWNGQSTVVLADSTGSTIYVAATGAPYIVYARNTSKSQGGQGSVTIDQYGSAPVPAVPTGAISLPGS